MKLKLFNGTLTSLSLSIVAGGYDPEIGRVVVHVNGEAGQAGTLLVDPTEAVKLAAMLTSGLPKIERVDVAEPIR
jgi:hypothetical protein